jgi:7,8-dihydropterin-6-yl-methyl-4-(beta-D-ribofuranosyl)aminobenzene 5'-phosphate synthase
MRRYLFLIGAFLFFCTGCSPEMKDPGDLYPGDEIQNITSTKPNTSTVTVSIIEEIPTTTPDFQFSKATGIIETRVVTETPTMKPLKPLKITVVYDNYAYDERLATDWGFAALVKYQGHTLLFDTGANGRILMQNMNILEIDPTRIDSVLLSHSHADHTGGLQTFLETGVHPTVYMPASFSTAFKNLVKQYTTVVETTPGQHIAEGLYTTGELGQSIREQALVIQLDTGLVVITGCAHPGIVSIIEKAQELFAEPIILVMGGFHLGGKSRAEIDVILRDFRRLGVQKVAPCHCTGEPAISMFAAEYGDDFIQVGAGKKLVLNQEEE